MREIGRFENIVKKHWEGILVDWVDEQMSVLGKKRDLISDNEIKAQSKEFLILFQESLAKGGCESHLGPEWRKTRDFLSALSISWGDKGLSPSETATFVFSIKQPILKRLRQEGDLSQSAFEDFVTASQLVDKLGLFTTEVYQKSREVVIRQQQDEMMELSTPVIKLWQGILALPMIGTLDSNRTQTVMETLLQKIMETEAEIAIIDITGVPTVDTLVAQHLMKTVKAARLMGAECIVSGIRPQIAQTIVHLGVDLGDIITKATLADALSLALQRRGLRVTASKPEANKAIST